MTVLELYNELAQWLNSAKKRDIRWIIKENCLAMTYEWKTKKVSPKKEQKIRDCVSRLKAGEPLQYILGFVPFVNSLINVDSRVLIPRFETELLAYTIIDDYKNTNFIKVLDLCTGSGCLAVSLSKQIPNSLVFASDVSDDALKVAKKNIKENDVNVTLIRSDMLKDITDTFDVIVSNPPYLTKKEMGNISRSIKKYEPKLALYCGEDGLDFYRKIATDAPSRLTQKGVLYLEVGDGQARDVIQILETNFCDFEIINDYNDFERFVKAVKR